MTEDSLENIENLVASAFDAALKEGDIIFKGDTVVQERIDGCSVEYSLPFCSMFFLKQLFSII